MNVTYNLGPFRWSAKTGHIYKKRFVFWCKVSRRKTLDMVSAARKVNWIAGIRE